MKKYMYLAIAAVALTACSSSDDDLGTSNSNYEPVAAQISAGVSNALTRADGSKWEADNIGVIVTAGTVSGSSTLTMYKNALYTTTSTTSGAASFESDNGIYFQDKNETVTFAAYGPYVSSASIATLPGENGVISGSTASQSTRELQKAFDYIYASGAQASSDKPYIMFNGTTTTAGGSDDNYITSGTSFSHKMAKLNIIVQPSGDLNYSNITSGTYTFSGINHSGTFNVTTGTAATSGSSTTTDWSLNDNSMLTQDATNSQITFSAILYPQNLSSVTPEFSATIGGRTYKNSGGINPNLQAGKSYTYTVTVSQSGILAVNAWEVTDWEDQGGGSVSAVIQE